ncbi:hypothetical protein [Bythopirellula goksoeyrii]|uniref:Uncharacterized protein n=1 Tax=Bythopirellula goksoeyrii TaxID=1400387 RepID=A0A5B9QBC9_9BACT|nr:hypothetical protein [Bythopirellula goksoeyrii]QEG36228.1 hypothetical protein Pr1d_35400 [Bythopirellula goksoeyrii]
MQSINERQQLIQVIKERPEFIEAVVERTVSQFVEGLLEERRDELGIAVESAIKQSLLKLSTEEFLDLVVFFEEAEPLVKPLTDSVLDKTRQKFAMMMRYQWEEIINLKIDLRKLRETVEGDGDWWR